MRQPTRRYVVFRVFLGPDYEVGMRFGKDLPFRNNNGGVFDVVLSIFDGATLLG